MSAAMFSWQLITSWKKNWTVSATNETEQSQQSMYTQLRLFQKTLTVACYCQTCGEHITAACSQAFLQVRIVALTPHVSSRSTSVFQYRNKGNNNSWKETQCNKNPPCMICHSDCDLYVTHVNMSVLCLDCHLYVTHANINVLYTPTRMWCM